MKNQPTSRTAHTPLSRLKIENLKSKMTPSILAILAALVPLFAWLIRRHINHEDDPYNQHAEKREALAKEIIQDDETAANRTWCLSASRLDERTKK